MIPAMILSFEAGAATVARRIARFSDVSASQKVAPASANTDPIIGVFDRIAGATGDIVDVIVEGQALVELGGTVTAGAPLTTDASGRAIVATPAAATTVRVLGFALEPGVIGDIAKVLVQPSLLRTP
jgi:hypothetical protein